MLRENPNFSEIPGGAEQVKKLLGSPEGQALIRLLQADGGAGLRSAVKALQAGDTEAAKQALSPLLAGTDGERLAEKLRERL